MELGNRYRNRFSEEGNIVVLTVVLVFRRLKV